MSMGLEKGWQICETLCIFHSKRDLKVYLISSGKKEQIKHDLGKKKKKKGSCLMSSQMAFFSLVPSISWYFSAEETFKYSWQVDERTLCKGWVSLQQAFVILIKNKCYFNVSLGNSQQSCQVLY